MTKFPIRPTFNWAVLAAEIVVLKGLMCKPLIGENNGRFVRIADDRSEPFFGI